MNTVEEVVVVVAEDNYWIECFCCHKLGYIQYECLRVEKQAHYAMYEDSSEVEEEVLLVPYEATNLSAKQEDWFLGSGCSNHMTGNK